jgi:hypothetical protein
MSKIVHLGRNGSIMNNFVKFINEHFEEEKHIFFLTGKNLNNFSNVIDIKNKSDLIKYFFFLNNQIHKSNKIIIHSFDQSYLFFILLLQPWLIKKVYWAIWGWDLYSHDYLAKDLKTKIIQKLKKIIFPKIKHFITYLEEEYLLAKKYYNIKDGYYHECIMYPSNLCKDFSEINCINSNDTINIQIGNSASWSNNHLDIFDKISIFRNENLKIFLPFSYGENNMYNEILNKGKELFKDNFIPLTKILPLIEYVKFQNSVDIAIFAHNQQEAMGNIITLLALGKKVYIKNSTTSWCFFKNMDIKVYDFENISIDLIDENIKRKNQQKIKDYFSEENYIKQLKKIFESK